MVLTIQSTSWTKRMRSTRKASGVECPPAREPSPPSPARLETWSSPVRGPTLTARIFIVPLETGEYIVYAPLERAAFVANRRLVNFLADLRAGRFDPALDPDGSLVEFLRRLRIIDGPPEQTPSSDFSGSPHPTAVTLFLTTACNLRCTYCYASAGDTPRKFMGLEVAQRGIDFIIRNALRKRAAGIDVNFHGGGEPSVNWTVLTESFEYARDRTCRHGIGLKSALATNGVLSDAKIDWLIGHLDGVSLSFDGLPEAHDAHRITPSGGGSSQRVIHTLRRFDGAGFPYGLRVTVTHDQIDRLPESIRFICSQFRPRRIQVEPAYQMGRWSGAPSAETQGFIQGYREAQGIARRFGMDLSFSGARLGLLTPHFCGITQDSFNLSPDGNVSACFEVFSEDSAWSDVFFYGKPRSSGEGYTFDLPVLNSLRRLTVDSREFCQGCFAQWSCAGDCHHKSLTVNGTGPFAGTERCHIIRELTKDQILDRILQSGGFFWHEPPGSPASDRPNGEGFPP